MYKYINPLKIKLVFVAIVIVATIGGVALIMPSNTDAVVIQTAVNNLSHSQLPIGVNLAAPTYYSSEIPFADVFMLSSNWFHQYSQSTDPWDLGDLDVTEDGWPILEKGRGAACLMMRDIHGRYPKGIYVCTYKGRGEITFGFDAQIVSAKPNKIKFKVLHPSDSGILFKINSQDPNDPIRNVHIWLPNQSPDANEQQSIFNPLFLDRLKPFSVIRFMDWQGTNNSTLKSWKNRTLTTDRTQATIYGIAIDYMIELCNKLSVDPWFCIPHQADDEFIRHFAELLKDNLDPHLRIYIEYSNEVWNAQFDQYAWVNANGTKENQPANYATFAKRVFDIWHEVFAGQEDHVVRVAGCQLMNPWVAEVTLAELGSNVDALAPALYFGIREKYDELKQLGNNATAEDVMRIALQTLHDSVIPKMSNHAKLAHEFNVDLLTYEGGQHILPQPAGSKPPFLKAMWDAQRHELMYKAYSDMLESFEEINGKLFVAFNFVGRQDTQWGSWGLLDHLWQSPDQAPKYRAISDYAAKKIDAPH